MKTLKVKTRFGEFECHINLGKYANGNTCLSLSTVDGLPFSTVTVNFNKFYFNSPEDYAYLDVNNSPFVQHLFKKYNLGEYDNFNHISGYCVYPLYKLNLDEIKKYTKQ